jgi:hypothetical protein
MIRWIRIPGLAALTLLVLATAAYAAEAETPDADELAATKAAALADRTEALDALRAMSEFLAGQEHFRFSAEIAWDAVQPKGQMLEFGGSRHITVRRPDRLRVKAQRRDGESQLFRFDGQQISFWVPDEKAYVAIEKPGALDAALDYLVDDLDVPMPMADFVYSDLYAGVADRIVTAMVVDEETIAGTDCLHLGFTMEEADFQLWIASGEQPLPVRLVIDYKNATGRPQFRAGLSNWSFGIDTPDDLFAFVPPEGAERIPLATAVQNRDEKQQPGGGE